MAYKNIEDQRAASKRHYLINKQSYLDKNKKYRQSIHDFVKNIKENASCVDCGMKYPYYVMDFDHLEDKDFGVSYLMSTGRIKALKNEIKKCEIVCSNCHRQRTYKRMMLNSN